MQYLLRLLLRRKTSHPAGKMHSMRSAGSETWLGGETLSSYELDIFADKT